MRGRSYSPSPPPRGYGRRGRSPSPRGRYGGGGGGGGGGSRSRDAPTSLLVRNLRRDCRPEDLRRPFGQFGHVKDIYLPRDYYSGEPRGFGFIQFVEPAEAGEAKYQMDGSVFQGRQLTVVFAEENRKKPQDMRVRERGSRGRTHDRRRSPARYSRSPQYSESPPPRRARTRSHEYDSPPPKRRQELRSVSPQEKRHSRERSYSRSPPRGGRSPPYEGSRSRSRSLDRKKPSSQPPPPPYNGGGGSRSRSRSPVMRSPSPSRGRSRKAERVYSPPPPRGEVERGGGSHKD